MFWGLPTIYTYAMFNVDGSCLYFITVVVAYIYLYICSGDGFWGNGLLWLQLLLLVGVNISLLSTVSGDMWIFQHGAKIIPDICLLYRNRQTLRLHRRFSKFIFTLAMSCGSYLLLDVGLSLYFDVLCVLLVVSFCLLFSLPPLSSSSIEWNILVSYCCSLSCGTRLCCMFNCACSNGLCLSRMHSTTKYAQLCWHTFSICFLEA